MTSHIDKGLRKIRIVLSLCAAIAFLFFRLPPAAANNVSVENVELVGRDSDEDTIKIEFDISWSNAWYDSINKDAVWVFAKYCKTGCTPNGSNNPVWSHVKLASSGTNPEGFGTGTKQAGSNIGRIEIIVPSDKTGAFIQPAQQGSGTLDFHDVQLVWDYGTDGVSDSEAIASAMQVRVFAVEMTYIPEGGFYAGDGNSGTLGEFEFGDGSQNIPPAINSEEGISFRANSTDAWYYNSNGSTGESADGANFDLSESFPKGFNAFYLMKYELSKGQFRDFLNLLTRAQQNNVTITRSANFYVLSGTSVVYHRSGVRAPSSVGSGAVVFGSDLDADGTFNESNDGEWIALNHIRTKYILSYADWAALRPMTELEYEKAARGPLYPVAGEYAWGTTAIVEAQTLSNGGQASETVTQTGNGLSNYNNWLSDINGPARVGFAATATTTTRAAAGAGYYGNLDLSGNAFEIVVTVGNSYGRGFSGSHGDGVLTTLASYEGYATNLDWPGIDPANPARGASNEIIDAGGGLRGGGFAETAADLRISARAYAAANPYGGGESHGGRFARTSPEYD